MRLRQVTLPPRSTLAGTVTTYADLPVPASDYTGKFYRVTTAQGVWPVNRYPVGVYVSTGSTWEYIADFTEHDQASEITNDSSLSGTTVKDALDNLPSTYQPLDSDLTALANNSTNGLWTRTATGSGSARTITGTSNRLTVTNGDGVSGNPTVDISSSYVGQNTITAVGTLSSGNATAIVDAATESAAGKIEVATVAEVNTGTDNGRAVAPDQLAGSYAGTKVVSIYAVEGATTLTTGDGKAYLRIPPALNGMNLVGVAGAVVAKSTSGLPTVQLARGRQSSATTAHTFADILTTKITIDANEYDSKDAATAAVIDTSNDDVLTGDLIRVDVDVAGTGTTGLIVTLEFRLP